MARADWPVVAAAGALAALALGWWMTPRTAAVAQRVEAVAQPLPVSEPAPVLARAPLAPASSPAAPSPERRAGQVQVCGGTWVHLNGKGRVDEAELRSALDASGPRARVLAALRAQGSERARAAALFLDYTGSQAAIERAAVDACGPAGCPKPAIDPAVSAARIAQVDALARFAVTSTDPQAYAWALQACRGDRGSEVAGACGLLSVDRWAQLDPGNAAPWRWVLGDAVKRRDSAAAAEALYRMSVATRDERGVGVLPAVVLAHVGDAEVDLPGITGLLGELALTGPGMEGMPALVRMCRAGADPNRQQVCERVAEVMAERSDSLVARSMSAVLSAGSASSLDRADTLIGEAQAYGAATRTQRREGEAALSCTDMRANIERARRVAQLGEVGALRDWRAHAGMTAADFLALGRKRRTDAMQARAAARASDAASTSR